MPQCQFPVFCCFCVLEEKLHMKYSRNWTKQVPKVLFCPEASREPKRRRSGATRAPHTRLVRPRPWPRHLGVRAPWLPPDDAASPIRSLGTENPRGVDENFQKSSASPPPPPMNFGGQKSLFRHPAGTGKCPDTSPTYL
jgi:hypothetical protein